MPSATARGVFQRGEVHLLILLEQKRGVAGKKRAGADGGNTKPRAAANASMYSAIHALSSVIPFPPCAPFPQALRVAFISLPPRGAAPLSAAHPSRAKLPLRRAGLRFRSRAEPAAAESASLSARRPGTGRRARDLFFTRHAHPARRACAARIPLPGAPLFLPAAVAARLFSLERSHRMSTETSAGLTPDMREACPSERGPRG